MKQKCQSPSCDIGEQTCYDAVLYCFNLPVFLSTSTAMAFLRGGKGSTTSTMYGTSNEICRMSTRCANISELVGPIAQV
jgi:hypothetical protein